MKPGIADKAAIIEDYIQRIQQHYVGHEGAFETDVARQDAVVMNLQLACEAAIDISMAVIKIKQLDIPQSNRDVFTALQTARIIPSDLTRSLQAMAGFRHLSIYEDRALSLNIVRHLVEHHLDDLLDLSRACLATADPSHVKKRTVKKRTHHCS